MSRWKFNVVWPAVLPRECLISLGQKERGAMAHPIQPGVEGCPLSSLQTEIGASEANPFSGWQRRVFTAERLTRYGFSLPKSRSEVNRVWEMECPECGLRLDLRRFRRGEEQRSGFIVIKD